MVCEPNATTRPALKASNCRRSTVFSASMLNDLNGEASTARTNQINASEVLFNLHTLDQFFDPLKCQLIDDPKRQALVTIDLAIDFDTREKFDAYRSVAPAILSLGSLRSILPLSIWRRRNSSDDLCAGPSILNPIGRPPEESPIGGVIPGRPAQLEANTFLPIGRASTTLPATS
jgi:hypothetical protein